MSRSEWRSDTMATGNNTMSSMIPSAAGNFFWSEQARAKVGTGSQGSILRTATFGCQYSRHDSHMKSLSQNMMIPSVAEAEAKSKWAAIIQKASNRALGGGLAGGAAMAINVCALMWMRTTVNFQYRYGHSTLDAFKILYKEGGIPRFYRGLFPALAQAPISRFGDTAANAGMLALWDEIEYTKELPVFAKTLSASLAAASFRYFLMPIDAMKTIMQVEGGSGLGALYNKVKIGGPGVLWAGGAGAVAATFVGHYPWFFTYNYLDAYLPKYDRKTELPKYLGRAAVIGFCASAVSDTVSNSIRVLKTTTQTSTTPITYYEAFQIVVKKDGLIGLFTRGLGTKIISNGMQGLFFSVLWRLGQDFLAKRESASKKE